jgi:hypothetical protein
MVCAAVTVTEFCTFLCCQDLDTYFFKVLDDDRFFPVTSLKKAIQARGNGNGFIVPEIVPDCTGALFPYEGCTYIGSVVLLDLLVLNKLFG